MGTPIIKGTSGVITYPARIRFDPKRGQVISQKFKAVGTTGLLSKFDESVARGLAGELIQSPLMSELTVESTEVTGGGGTVPNYVSDTWQIVGNEVSENSFSNLVIMNAVSLNDREIIAMAIKDGSTLEDAKTKIVADTGGTYTSVTSATSKQFYKELQKGQDGYNVGQYVLRHTTNCSPSSGSNVSDSNVECLYTTAQLLSEVRSSFYWTNILPWRLYNKILSIPSRAAPAPEDAYYLWSWRKLPSTETLTANNRIEINTEYVLYLWSTLRYALAS